MPYCSATAEIMKAALDFAFAMSDLGPDSGARVFGIQTGQFAQQLTRAFIARIGSHQGHFHDLVAALVGARVEHALFAEAELLAINRALRNLQQGASVDGGNFDFGAKRRFRHFDGNLDFDVIAIAVEERMFRHPHGDVQIAWRRAHGAGVALARHAQAAAAAGTRRNSYFDRFRAGDAAFASAGGAGVAQLARPAAAWAGEAELHGAGHLGDVAGTMALRAGDFTPAARARTVARGADFVAVDVELGLGAADGLPEIDIHYIFEIAALLGLGLRLLRATLAAEELREDIAETAGIGAPAARELIGKIESVEVHSRVRIRGAGRGRGESALGIETMLAVHLALLGVAENVVGFLHVLEAIFGGLVPRIQIRVVFTREFAISLADIIRVGFARYAQCFVVVVLGRRGHACPRWLFLGYFLSLSSTSTNSASTTSSLPPLGWPPSLGGGGGPPACCEDAFLYMASASLWLAAVSRSTAELVRSGSFSAMAFLVSSMAASISLASASPILPRCSLSVFSKL